MFRHAIGLDPYFGDAHVGLADTLMWSAVAFQTYNLVEINAQGEAAARLVIALDANNACAYTTLGLALVGQGNFDGAIGTAERALELSPNLAVG